MCWPWGLGLWAVCVGWVRRSYLGSITVKMLTLLGSCSRWHYLSGMLASGTVGVSGKSYLFPMCDCSQRNSCRADTQLLSVEGWGEPQGGGRRGVGFLPLPSGSL